MGQMVTGLDIILIKEPGTWTLALWRLAQPLVYYSTVLQETISVPEGFQTDLASVPRLPLVWLLAGGSGNAAAVIHDFLYRDTQVTKLEADKVFYEVLVDTSVPRWRAWLMYLAVRWFGRPNREIVS